MLDDKKIKEAELRVKQYLSEGVIKTKQQKEFVDFFLSNAEKSLKKLSKKEDIIKIVEEYKTLNKKLQETSEDYYTESEKSHSNFLELENMSDEQIIYNFLQVRIPCSLLPAPN